ncbi:MAG TPA: glycosyltransferase [Spirochaetota bacterium]|nr:glycosyltransferase [Spirochaetota bacterium]HOR43444.1 glycosyltransferase [Spirochaetota bacterium]HPK55463.1 glycosyltransferase [Spirochaetota bacterium]
MSLKSVRSNFFSRNKPFFSVIIPVFNRKEFIERAVNSVLSQDLQDYELIIVDDGSTDGLDNVIFRSDIIVIRKENGGVSSARNAGIRKASGEYIAFLDSDDEWKSNKLSLQQKFIVENPEIRIFQSDEEWIRRGEKVNPKNIHQKIFGDIFYNSLKLCLVSPSAVVVRNDIFDQYGLFDEKMPVCEDYDLWLRISAREPFGLLNEKLIIKYGGAHDQLSSSKWGMDRYRIYSMIKFLDGTYERLSSHKEYKLKEELFRKIEVLLKGCIKHGRIDFALHLENLRDSIGNNLNSTDSTFLLQE